MFQGSAFADRRNYKPFPFDATKIDAVLLTHAHIDHSGMLPKLMRAGFKGPIHSTPGTKALASFLLPDSGGIQEMEVEQLNRRNQRFGNPEVTPVYTKRDAIACLELFRTAPLNTWVQVRPGIRARWWNAGHILGAGSIEVEITDGGAVERLLFSGDIGTGNSEFAADPTGPSGVDHIVMESTYGDQVREFLSPEQRQAKLVDEMQKAHALGGPLLIPAFAVERTQELVVDLLNAMNSGLAPRGPIFVDSPLAIRAMDTYLKYGRDDDGSNPFKDLRESNWLQFTESVDESKNIERVKGWHVIVSSSGMCDAGRVRHHLRHLLWQQNATVMLVGYQAIGTLGRMLRYGKKTVRIMGDEITVNVSTGPEQREVPDVSSLSYAEAVKKLTDAGFGRFRQTASPSAPEMKDRVVGTNPPANQTSAITNEITIVVGSGPESRPVPDVKDQTVDSAQQVLNASGFVKSVPVDVDSPEPQGTVLGTSPQAGENAALDTVVQIQVSRGNQFTMPDLRGQFWTDAEPRLRALGWTGVLDKGADVRDSGQRTNAVVTQSPAPGTPINFGSTITLSFAA